MAALGGVPRVLVPLAGAPWLDATWSPAGDSIAYGLEDSLFVLPVNGGTARPVGRIPELHSCSWAPDGRWIACASGNRQFVRNQDFGNIAASSVWVIPAKGGTAVQVTDDQSLNTSPAWLPRPGTLLYVSNHEGGRDLYQMTLSRSGRRADAPVRLTTGVNAASVSVSAAGRRLVYPSYVRTANVWSVEIPATGLADLSRAQPVTTGNQEIEAFDVSADGRWLVFDSDRSGTQQLYRMPVQGGEVEQLTNSEEPSMAPSLSRDGREIAYHTFRSGTRQLFVMPVEGGTPVQITHDSGQNRIAFWAPDGRSLAFQKGADLPSQSSQIVSRDAADRWGPARVLLKGGDVSVPSPDGRRVLTLTNRGELVTVPVSGGPPTPVNLSKVAAPAHGFIWTWSSDGRMIYFVGKSQTGNESGIWRVPAGGGSPRIIVRFDEPSRYLLRPWIRVRDNRIYFTRGDFQSDVWMTEISERR
jgi:Tol biopolymer transport system component